MDEEFVICALSGPLTSRLLMLSATAQARPRLPVQRPYTHVTHNDIV